MDHNLTYLQEKFLKTIQQDIKDEYGRTCWWNVRADRCIELNVYDETEPTMIATGFVIGENLWKSHYSDEKLNDDWYWETSVEQIKTLLLMEEY